MLKVAANAGQFLICRPSDGGGCHFKSCPQNEMEKSIQCNWLLQLLLLLLEVSPFGLLFQFICNFLTILLFTKASKTNTIMQTGSRRGKCKCKTNKIKIKNVATPLRSAQMAYS